MDKRLFLPFMAAAIVWAMLLTGCTNPLPPPPPPPPPPPAGQWTNAVAIWYGAQFHGRQTTSGQEFDMEKLTGSHVSLPMGAKVEVVSLKTGKQVFVTINDRSQYEPGHPLAISKAAAQQLGVYPQHSFRVRYRWMK